MTKARVPLWGNPQKSVEVERGATAGAVIGRDVFNPDGTLFVPGTVATPTASLPVTVWEKVANIPANVAAVAGLTGDGFVRKAGTAWTASAIVNADLAGADTDGLGEGATNLYYTPERVRDVIGATLVEGSNVTITVNDPGDTITIAAAGGGGGSGSLIKLGEVVVTLATTDIDFTGLDLETAGRYMLVASHVPNAAGAQTVRLYYNGDTTTANYYRTFMGSDGANPAYGGGGVEAEIYASGDTSTPYHALAEVILSKEAGNRAHAISRVARYTSTGAFGILNYSHVRFSSTDNVTSIKLRNSVANGFGVGTRVALYRLA